MGFFRVVWGPCSPSRRSEPIRTDWFTSRRKFLESLCLFFLFFSPSLSPLSPDLEKTWPAVIVSVNYADSEQPTPLEPGLESRIIMLSLFSINILLLALFFFFVCFLMLKILCEWPREFFLFRQADRAGHWLRITICDQTVWLHDPFKVKQDSHYLSNISLRLIGVDERLDEVFLLSSLRRLSRRFYFVRVKI